MGVIDLNTRVTELEKYGGAVFDQLAAEVNHLAGRQMAKRGGCRAAAQYVEGKIAHGCMGEVYRRPPRWPGGGPPGPPGPSHPRRLRAEGSFPLPKVLNLYVKVSIK